MKTWRVVRQAVAWCLVALAVGAVLQAVSARESFQPKVGQAGKDVVWVPSPEMIVNTMLDMAKVTPQDYVIDLGSGDGRTVIAAAKRGARALGIEYDAQLVEVSKRNAAAEGVGERATFVQGDLFETDFSQATVITLFLLEQINLQLRPKILDLKPGTRIVSNTFEMAEWEADETVTQGDDCTTWCTTLLWIVPAKVEGTWTLPGGELTLEQAFQMLSGTFMVGRTPTEITDGRMLGDQIRFSVGGATYTGRVGGNTMEGTFSSGGSEGRWNATREP